MSEGAPPGLARRRHRPPTRALMDRPVAAC